MIFGWGNGGWGGFGNGNNGANSFLPYAVGANGALTRGELCQDMNFQEVQNGVRGIQQGLCDGFYAINTSLLNGFHGVDNAVCSLGYQTAQLANGINQNITDSRFDAKQCCCETNRNIDAVRYENARNTCDIITASQANTQRIIDIMTQDKMDSLRDQLQTANFQLSQQAQNAYLVNQLRPCPIPAYLSCSPYQTYGFNGYNGYGYNNGNCGCNSGCCGCNN